MPFLPKKICGIIADKGGDYLFTVKDNQRKLRRDIDRCLALLAGSSRRQDHTTENSGHGRSETRHIALIPAPEALKKTWPGLQAVGTITRTRQQHKTGKTSVETVYFITSLDKTAPDILALNRAHWRIENNLHRHKDVLFDEDRSTIRCNAAPHNMAVCRASALAFLKSLRQPLPHTTQDFARNPDALFHVLLDF
ncbi:MAG TPA: ISAs1 family transposase [Synechococcus sp. M44_DOE_062]|nr:ISAs1 family transposase [Synechococcus sp. M44_DOE_062]